MLCLCDKRPDGDDVDPYKDFAQLIRRKELEETYVHVTDDTSSEKLKEYVHLIKDVKLQEGTYHIYYGQVKKIITSFLHYYGHAIDIVIKKTDYYTHVIDRDELIVLVEKTISSHETKQVEFGKTFLPVKTPWEKRVYEDIEKLYEESMKRWMDIKEVVYFRLDRQTKVEEFVADFFPVTVRKTSEIFDTAHLYLGKMVADRVKEIRVSLEEIERRLRNNLDSIRGEREDVVHRLLCQLYDKNKESISVTRRATKNSVELAEAFRGEEKQTYIDSIRENVVLRLLCQLYDKNKESISVTRRAAKNSVELAEVNRAIDSLRTKIEQYQTQCPIHRLEKELSHWKSKLDDFNQIAHNLAALRTQQDQTAKEQGHFQFLKCKQLPECEQECATSFRDLYTARMEHIRDRIVHETRAMITFFAVRGGDRIVHSGGAGQYYVDEYNHQVYVSEHGYRRHHMDCYGRLFELGPEEAYYYDRNGRYIIKDGEKIYQVAPCTSHYKLNEENYFEKITKDCGHSVTGSKSCRMEIKDPTDVTILPDIEPIDISKTLPKDTVRYLWDAFGSILPEALHDVGAAKPKNPIHFLAHKLLHHKYRRITSELKQKKKEAEQYRSNIIKERTDKVSAASRLWKSKQVKRRKPEESDDSGARAYNDARIAEEMFIMALNTHFGN